MTPDSGSSSVSASEARKSARHGWRAHASPPGAEIRAASRPARPVHAPLAPHTSSDRVRSAASHDCGHAAIIEPCKQPNAVFYYKRGAFDSANAASASP